MTPSLELEQTLARKLRGVAVVITVALVLWLAARWVHSEFGVTPIFTIMLNLVTMAAFFWCIFTSYQIWRLRRQIRAEDKPRA